MGWGGERLSTGNITIKASKLEKILVAFLFVCFVAVVLFLVQVT